MAKLQDYINSFTMQGFDVEDVSNSMSDYLISRSRIYYGIAEGFTLCMEDNVESVDDIDDRVYAQEGFHIKDRALTLSNGEIINVSDVIEKLIYIRDNDVDDSSIIAKSGNSISIRDVVSDMSKVSYNNDALISSFKSISATATDASSGEIYNTFTNILSSVNSTNNEYSAGVKNIFINILGNKNLTKKEKLFALLEQFTNIGASYDDNIGKVEFSFPSYSSYTGVSPITAWLAQVDFKIDSSLFYLWYPKILQLEIRCCSAVINAIGNFAVKAAHWVATKFITGSNFKTNGVFNEPYVDIPVCTRFIWLSQLMNSQAEINPYDLISPDFTQSINRHLTPETRISQATVEQIVKDMIPLKGHGYLTIPCLVGKILIDRAYDIVDTTPVDVIRYQVFISPSSFHTVYGDDVQYVGNSSGGTTTFNHSLKDFYNSYINTDFTEIDVDTDEKAGKCLRSSLYRLNLWTLMLAVDPSAFSESSEPEWWNSTSYSTQVASRIFTYLGGNINDGSSQYYTGYLYSLAGKSNNNPLGNVTPYPTNLELINIITNSLNISGYTEDTFLATILKHLVLNNSYVLNNCTFDEGKDPVFIPYYIGNGIGTKFKYSIATDSDNAKTFSNFLVKTAVVAAVVGLGVGYVKLKLWGTGLVASWSARYTADLVQLSKLPPGSSSYSSWLAKSISDRKKLQWVSLLGSIIGGSAGVPDVLDRTTNSIIDLGTTSNKEVLDKLSIVNGNIIGT